MSELLNERKYENRYEEPAAGYTETITQPGVFEKILFLCAVGHTALSPNLVDTHTLPTIAEVTFVADESAEPQKQKLAA